MSITGSILRLALVVYVFSGTTRSSDYDYDWDYDYDYYYDDYEPWDYEYEDYEQEEAEIEWVALPEELMNSETISASEQAMVHIPSMAAELRNLDCNLAGGFIKQIYSNVKGSADVMLQVKCADITSYIVMRGNMTDNDLTIEVMQDTPRGIGTMSDIIPDFEWPIDETEDDYDYDYDYDYFDYEDVIPIAEDDNPEDIFDYDYDSYPDYDYYAYDTDCIEMGENCPDYDIDYSDEGDYETDEFDYGGYDDSYDYDYDDGLFMGEDYDFDYEYEKIDYDYNYNHGYNRYDYYDYDYNYNYEETESTDTNEKVLQWIPVELNELGQVEEFLERTLFALPELKTELNQLGCPDPTTSAETGDHFLVQIYGNQIHFQDQLFEVNCQGMTSFIRYFGSPFGESSVSTSSEKPTNVIEEYKPGLWDDLFHGSDLERDESETEKKADEPVSWEQLPQQDLDDNIHFLEQALFLSPRTEPELVKLGCSEPDFEADYEDPGSFLIAAFGNRQNQMDQLFEVNCNGQTSYIRYLKKYDGQNYQFYVETTAEKPGNVVELKRGEMFPWVWKKDDQNMEKKPSKQFWKLQGIMYKRMADQSNSAKADEPVSWKKYPQQDLDKNINFVEQALFSSPRLKPELIKLGCSEPDSDADNGNPGSFLISVFWNEHNQIDQLFEVNCNGQTSFIRYMQDLYGRSYVKSTTEKPGDVVELKRGEMFPWMWKKNEKNLKKPVDEHNRSVKGT